jgi:hypothetical protein
VSSYLAISLLLKTIVLSNFFSVARVAKDARRGLREDTRQLNRRGESER